MEIVNKVYKIITETYEYVFIMQTEGDDDYWYWAVSRADVTSYFAKKGILLLSLDKEKAEQFVNDDVNEFLGCSVASFNSVEEAEMDYKGGSI